MLKKSLAAAGIAALLVLGGASAASAAQYPPTVACTAAPATIEVGATSTITCTGLDGLETAYFGTDGTPGGSVSSIVFASATGPVAKPVTDGTAVASFTSTQAGTFVIAVGDGETVLGTATVTVTAASSGGLPATGSTIPAAALWLGVGAIGIGGIAVAAAVARRRAQQNR